MRRLLRFSVVLSSSLLCGACLGEVTSVLSADITTEGLAPVGAEQWFSCSDVEGCFFRGQGHLDATNGTASQICTTSLTGVVSFADSAGIGIKSAGQSAVPGFAWKTDPDPKATLRAGDAFKYVTTQRVPRFLVDAARLYASTPQAANLHAC